MNTFLDKPPKPVSLVPRTILIVGDKPAELETWSNLLKRSDPQHTVLEATTMDQAIALWRDQTADCILLDLDMADEIGFTLLKTFNPYPARPAIAVVGLTRLPHPYLQDTILSSGAQAMLIKTLMSPTELTHAIHEAITIVASSPPPLRQL